jgi:hypothetical protein
MRDGTSWCRFLGWNSWDEFNAHLEEQYRKRRERRLRGHAETIGERFERDRAAMLPLAAASYEPAKISRLGSVRYRSNDYSVPTQYGHRQVWVKGYVHEVVIVCASEMIARHERSYEREVVVFDPLHYLALLERKTRALDQAAPLVGSSCRSASRNCGVCSKRGSRSMAIVSMCRYCGCWRPSPSRK